MVSSSTPPPPYTSQSSRDPSKLSRSDSLNKEMPYSVSESEILCPICLEAMDEEEGNLFTVTACSHTYHMKCIEKWKEKSRKCPCCRGALADEMGSTIPSFVWLDVNQSAIFFNVVFCVPSMVYPICLFSLVAAFEGFLLATYLVLFFWMNLTNYETYQDQSIASAFRFIFLLCTLWPLLAFSMCLVFILHICYAFFRTLKFYGMVFMCKIHWFEAYGFIVKKAISVTKRYFNRYRVFYHLFALLQFMYSDSYSSD